MVAARLDAPLPEGWQVDSHAARTGRLDIRSTPTTRWQRGSQPPEIRSVAEWFGPETARHAFIELWKALHEHLSARYGAHRQSQTVRGLANTLGRPLQQPQHPPGRSDQHRAIHLSHAAKENPTTITAFRNDH